MNDLTKDERKRVQVAFYNGTIPGSLICSAGLLLRWSVDAGATGMHVVAMLISFGGLITLFTMAFVARRREIEAVRAQRGRT